MSSRSNGTLCRPSNCKGICTRDSIRNTFGEYKNEDNYLWKTSTMKSFHKPCNHQVKQLPIDQCRDKTNFVFGFDKVRYLTTTKDFKWSPESLPTSSLRNPVDATSNIPDFCSKYHENKDFGSSEYKTTYLPIEKNDRPVIPSLAERRKKTNDLRSTHFDLGNFDSKFGTETQHSFNRSAASDDLVRKNKPKRETYKSSVFREGDWNGSGLTKAPNTVTQLDFKLHDPINTETSSDDQRYHHKVHFNMGSLHDDSISLYSKDFRILHPNCYNRFKITTPPKPPLADIFPCDNKTTSDSVNHSDFTRKSKDEILRMVKERRKELADISDTNNKSSISFLQDQHTDLSKRILSMNKSAYCPKYVRNDGPTREVNKQYNHLLTNPNAETPLSEFQASYLVRRGDARTIRNECMNRRSDNKATHFAFGSSNTSDLTLTEQKSQYLQRSNMDTKNLTAAGKSLPQFKKFNHIFSCGNGKQSAYHPLSEMKSTYGKLNLSENSSTPKRSNDNTLPTHFFHMDDEYAGSLKTTTQSHFVPRTAIIF